MSIADWAYLRCDCGGDLFAPLVRLKYKQDGGTVPEPAGYHCLGCNGVADTGRLAHLIDLDRKRREIKRLQQEVAETEPALLAAGARVAATK